MAIETALYENLVTDLVSRFGDSITEPLAPEDKGSTFAAKTLLGTLLKKCITQVESDADQVALSTFLDSNEKCGNWSLKMETMLDEYLIGHFRQEIYEALYPLIITPESLFEKGRCGPGSSLGTKHTDFYRKLYDSELTFTGSWLLRSYRNYIKPDLRWSAAEKFRTDTHGDGSVVKGSKLAFVPKRNDISRVICVEPSLNMYVQLGLGVELETILKDRYRIDLSTQPDDNRELARLGSLDGDLCTIDLSSASDSISLKMLEEFLPTHVLSWLKLLRSPKTILPDGEELELNMVSSMGNGFTFPLETLIFSAVVSAVYKLNGIHLKFKQTYLSYSARKKGKSGIGKRHANFGVFGDDIICKKQCFHQIVRLLNLLGFTVNADKTFSEGLFRESCGADFLEGYPVRGVYLKDLTTANSRYVAINRLMVWSARHGIPLPRTIRQLVKTVPWNPVPLHENDDSGVKIPLKFVAPKAFDSNYAVKYKPWVSRPSRYRITDTKVVTRKNAKAGSFNVEGLYLAFLGGYITNNVVTLRTPRVLYVRSKAVSASWDFLSPDLQTVGLARLTAVVETCFW
jgi:hypothetical protein